MSKVGAIQATAVAALLVAVCATAHAESLSRSLKRVMDPGRLAAGKVQAVAEDSAVAVVQPISLEKQFSESAFLVDNVRSAPIFAAVPAVLRDGAGPAARAVQLSQEIVAPALGDAAERTVKRFRTFARDSTGLRYSVARQAYVGEFMVAFADTEDGAARQELITPVPLLIEAVGARSIEPSPVEVSKAGQWYKVRLEVPAPNDPYRLAVSASPDDKGDSITLAIVRPTIQLTSDTRRVVGWGFGKVAVRVHYPEADAEGGIVTLAPSIGTLSSAAVALDASGRGSTELRSGGQGQTSISVKPPYSGEPLVITFISPVLFIVLAVAGGLIGAFITRRDRSKWISNLAVGALTGFFMAAAYVVGIDWVAMRTGWTGIANSGELVVFVLGALGAIVGATALKLRSVVKPDET